MTFCDSVNPLNVLSAKTSKEREFTDWLREIALEINIERLKLHKIPASWMKGSQEQCISKVVQTKWSSEHETA